MNGETAELSAPNHIQAGRAICDPHILKSSLACHRQYTAKDWDEAPNGGAFRLRPVAPAGSNVNAEAWAVMSVAGTVLLCFPALDDVQSAFCHRFSIATGECVYSLDSRVCAMKLDPADRLHLLRVFSR